MSELIVAARLASVPGSVYRQGKFRFSPVDFAIENDSLEARIIDHKVQLASLSSFKENPAAGQTFIVAANPDDMKAKYFAAYLATIHQKKLKHLSNIVWEQVQGGYTNKILQQNEDSCSMLILSGLAVNSTQAKIEKARDIIEKFCNIPVVVCVAGEDPISFAATKLHLPCHALAYFPSKLSKSVNEVI